MRGKRLSIRFRVSLAILAVALFVTGSASSQQETVLHSFNNNGTDGYHPVAGLIFDASGNLYGTTNDGGVYGVGTVFELMPTTGGSWTETVLHSFDNNGTDGWYPLGSLILDASGNLYGTTEMGGAKGYGTVFELTPIAGGSWTENILYSFRGPLFRANDGAQPETWLIFDASGNLYGTTYAGGAYGSGGNGGYGTVFELTPIAGGSWTETVLHSFDGSNGGAHPSAGLILDATGSLYGTTSSGGVYGYGTVFKLTPTTGGSWSSSTLHTFNNNGKDGYGPYGGLIFDASGNLYGTTYAGGAYGVGTVFELISQGGIWKETILHSFNNNGTDGYGPYAGLIFDAFGNLYGAARNGGTHGYGTVFELTSQGGIWKETILHNFNKNGTDGWYPDPSLIFDASGNLYGTTIDGGAYSRGTMYGYGTVFEITP